MKKKRAGTQGHFHAVRFYENQAALANIVAEFLGEGLITGEPALVIATPEHRAAIVEALRARHIDPAQAEAAGDLLLLDAREMLSRFMVDGSPDAERFYQHAERAIERACRRRTDCTIRAYGEMVDLLWKDGADVAAIRLEMLWNTLAMTKKFSLLCGYGMGNFYKDGSVADICQQHTHGVSAQGVATPLSAGSQLTH